MYSCRLPSLGRGLQHQIGLLERYEVNLGEKAFVGVLSLESYAEELRIDKEVVDRGPSPFSFLVSFSQAYRCRALAFCFIGYDLSLVNQDI